MLIDGAACVITNDTGPMHVAFSLNRPTVCLFGPGSPEHYGVDNPNVQILYKGIFCSPCIYGRTSHRATVRTSVCRGSPSTKSSPPQSV